MADPRRLSSGQRSLMGPPETPNRMMHASPNLFPSLQFSPDLFSHNGLSPATAPAYPQQSLFWDGSTAGGIATSNIHQYQDPFNLHQEDLSHSFNSNSTIIPSFHHNQQVPEPQAYDLPTFPRPTNNSYADGTTLPMSFTTSPRVPPPRDENPSLFLSSPARRFGMDGQGQKSYQRNPVPERPAYYHQMEESKREQELKKIRKSDIQHASVTRSVLEALRRPISPAKDTRPGLKRSLTHSGVGGPQHLRHQSHMSFNDAGSTTSSTTTRSNRTGRSSPLKFLGDGITRTASSRRNNAAKRSSLSLAIDENGVAKTVVTRLLNEEDIDMDDSSLSGSSSLDDSDFHILHSQDGPFLPSDDDRIPSNFVSGQNNRHSKTNSYSTMASSVSTRYPPRTSSMNSSSFNKNSNPNPSHVLRKSRILDPMFEDDTTMNDNFHEGDAQQVLKSIIHQDRSRSASTQDDSASTRNSAQIHSSPPIVPSQFNAFNASPTTVTDPDLATPSTDRESFISNGSTRCICNSSNPDSNNLMIQCDSCSKWLHTSCVGIDTSRNIPEVYVCAYCIQTPMRHGRLREPLRSSLHSSTSPLAHKSQRQR